MKMVLKTLVVAKLLVEFKDFFRYTNIHVTKILPFLVILKMDKNNFLNI
jgi:hypothetical protein